MIDLRKLTDEQRKIAEDNIKLVYKFIYDNGLDVNEDFGEMAEAYCKAIRYYNPKKGALSTLVYLAMNQALTDRKRNWVRHYNACQRSYIPIKTVSLEGTMCENAGNISVKESLRSKSPYMEDSIQIKLMFQQWSDSLSKRDKQIIRDFFDEVPIDVMKKKYKMGNTAISNYKRSYIQRFTRYLRKADRQLTQFKVKDKERTKILTDEELDAILFG